jgi:hypothetical protein
MSDDQPSSISQPEPQPGVVLPQSSPECPADDPVELKPCSGCYQWLPVTEFRHRRRGGEARESRCRRRHAEYMRDHRKARASRLLGEFTAEMSRAGSLSQVTALATGTVAHFGGVHGLARDWADHLKAAPPAAKLDGFATIVRIWQLDEAHRERMKLRKSLEERFANPWATREKMGELG